MTNYWSYIVFQFFIFIGFSILSGQPILVTENPTTFTLGSFYEGEKVPFTICIKNVGNEDLILFDFKKSCGCLNFKFDPNQISILPGETKCLPIILDTKGFKGKLIKSLNFNSNDPNNSSITYSVEVTVIDEVEVEPNLLIVNKQNQIDTLYITNKTANAVQLDTLISMGAKVDFYLFKQDIPPFHKISIPVKIQKVFPQQNAKILVFFNDLHIEYKEIILYEN